MDDTQQRQEEQYAFPYHHLVSMGRRFGQTRALRWGFVYASYIERVLDILSRHTFRSLLDVGCGDGKFLLEARTRLPDRTIEGIDSSARAVAFARAFNPECTITVGDITDPRVIPRTYDAMTLIEVLEHIPPDAAPAFVAALRKRLTPDGVLVVTVPSTLVPRSPKHYRHFTIETLRDAIAPHFTVETYEYLNRDGWRFIVLRTLMTNPLWTLPANALSSLGFAWYRRAMLHADARTGTRLLALCRPQ